MTVDEMKQRFKKIEAPPEPERPVKCKCLKKELEEGKFWHLCPHPGHGDEGDIREHDELLARGRDRALSYPPSIPLPPRIPVDVNDRPYITIYKPAPGEPGGFIAVTKPYEGLSPDAHMGAVEADRDLDIIYSEYGG